MPDSRKPPRVPMPPPPPAPRRADPTGELSLSGAIELDPDSISGPVSLIEAIEPVGPEPMPPPAAQPSVILQPPPPPRPRRLTPPPPEPVRFVPPPAPHRVGIDATLPVPRRPSPAAPPTIQEPARTATSLFHETFASDSGPNSITTPGLAMHRDVEATWAEEIRVLEREIAACKDKEPARAALLLGAQAAILLGYRGDRDGARAALEQSLALGEDRYSLHLARREALAQRMFGRALELGRKELERVVEPRERVALLLQLGVLDERPGETADNKAALASFEAAREVDPRAEAALLALTELYLDEGSWEKLAATYHALADGSADAALRGMFRHAAGTIEERRLDRPELARATYRAALSDDAANLPAVVALSSLSLRTEDWAELARALETEGDRLADTAAQRRLYERAGDLYWERLSDADSATTAYRKAALAAPESVGPLRRLASVLESIGRWHELVDVLFAELPLCRSPEERAELHHLVGEINENHLERHEDALTSYQAALSEVPDHVASLQALAGLFARTRRIDAIIFAELGEAERIVEPERRGARYLHLGDLAAHVVGDEGEAVRLYERCRELAPTLRAAGQGLEAIYRRRGDHTRLSALYEAEAKSTTEPALRRLYLVNAAKSLLDADRADERRTLGAGHVQRVEEYLSTAQGLDEPDLGPSALIADALEDAGQWDALVGALAKLEARLFDTAEKIAVHHRIARVLELRLGSDARALKAYEEILAIDPAHEAALLALVRLHQRAGRSPQEIDALGRLRDRAPSPNDSAALSYRIGRIYERRLGDTEAALVAYEEALARRADFHPALRALERLLRRDRRWDRLIDVLERQRESARSGQERAALHQAIGQIAELHLRDLQRAEESYAAALKEGHEPAWAALAQVKEARGDHAGLGKLLDEQRKKLNEPSAVVAHLCRQAALAEGPLDDAAKAMALYAQALEHGPLGVRLQVALVRATRKSGGVTASTPRLRAFGEAIGEAKLREAVRVLVALREESQPGGERALGFDVLTTHTRSPVILDGKIRRALAEDAIDEVALATLLSERARVTDGAGLRALVYLEAACRFDRATQAHDAGKALEAADQSVNDLIPVLRGVRRMAMQSEQFAAAAALYAHEAELSRDSENQAEAQLAAGELSLYRVGDARQALEHFRKLLSWQPLHAIASERALDIMERAKDWHGIAAFYKARAANEESPELRAMAWRRKAEVERDRLRDIASALASLREALVLAPDDLESWKAIAPLQEHQRFWQDAIETYRKIAELSRGEPLGRAARVREADLRERELGDRDGARSILEELVVDPSDRDAARRMAMLCERMGRWDEAKAMWTQLASTRAPQERADALFQLGQAQAQSGDEPMGSYVEALALAITTIDVGTWLEKRFREAGVLPLFAEAAEQALEKADDGGAGSRQLRTTLARVYVEDLHDPERAEQQLTLCTELAPDDPATFRTLGQLLVSTEQANRALPLLHRALDLEPSSPESLRALGEGLGATGLRDAPRIFETAAAHVEGSASPEPLPPLAVRRPLTLEEWASYFPRERNPGQKSMIELAHMLEPFAAQLVSEVTGERPRGEPVGGAAEITARATFQALGLQPMRLYVDAELGPEVLLCADDALALLMGPSLLEPAQAPRLTFEITRLAAWIAQGETLGAALRGRTLAGFVSAACDEHGDDEVKELRRRLGKALPRKTRKELERFAIPLADAAGVTSTWERSGYAASEELALLVSRDAGVLFESLGYVPGEPLPANGRGVDIVRFLASEDCWRAYRRLLDG